MDISESSPDPCALPASCSVRSSIGLGQAPADRTRRRAARTRASNAASVGERARAVVTRSSTRGAVARAESGEAPAASPRLCAAGAATESAEAVASPAAPIRTVRAGRGRSRADTPRTHRGLLRCASRRRATERHGAIPGRNDPAGVSATLSRRSAQEAGIEEIERQVGRVGRRVIPMADFAIQNRGVEAGREVGASISANSGAARAEGRRPPAARRAASG